MQFPPCSPPRGSPGPQLPLPANFPGSDPAEEHNCPRGAPDLKTGCQGSRLGSCASPVPEADSPAQPPKVQGLWDRVGLMCQQLRLMPRNLCPRTGSAAVVYHFRGRGTGPTRLRPGAHKEPRQCQLGGWRPGPQVGARQRQQASPHAHAAPSPAHLGLPLLHSRASQFPEN